MFSYGGLSLSLRLIYELRSDNIFVCEDVYVYFAGSAGYRLWWVGHLVFKDLHSLIVRVWLLGEHFPFSFSAQTRESRTNKGPGAPEVSKPVFCMCYLCEGPLEGVAPAGWWCLTMSLMSWLGSRRSALLTLDRTMSSGGGPRVGPDIQFSVKQLLGKSILTCKG